MITHKNFGKWNETMFDKYGESYYNNPIIHHIEKVRIGEIVKMLEVKENDEILEIGCGSGHILDKIDRGRLTGIDISQNALAIARKRLGKRVTLIRSNAENIKLNKKFDKIVCSELLEHVIEPANVINEIVGVSKSSTLILLTIPNEGSINTFKRTLITLHLYRILFRNTSSMNNEWHLHKFTLNKLKEKIRGKLKIIQIKVFPAPLIPMKYIILCKAIL